MPKLSTYSPLSSAPDSSNLVPITSGGVTRNVPVSLLLTPRFTMTWGPDDIATTGGRYNYSSSSGTGVSNSNGGVLLNTGSGDGAAASIRANSPNDDAPQVNIYDLNPEWGFMWRLNSTAESAQVYFVSVNANVATSNGTLTDQHVGFILDINAGTPTLYASNANGTTQTKTDISSGVTHTGVTNVFRIVMTSGTNIKFYVNGVLKATHTTNLPSGAMTSTPWLMYNDNETGSTQIRTVYLGNIYLSFNN